MRQPCESTPLGARVLRLCFDFHLACENGLPPEMALARLRSRANAYDPALLALLHRLPLAREEDESVREVGLAELEVGMVLVTEVRARSGAVLIAGGADVTATVIERLRNFAQGIGVKEPLRVRSSWPRPARAV